MEFTKQIEIRNAVASDINDMVVLSSIKRQQYESIQPTFWHRSHKADELQTVWFCELLERKDYIMLVATDKDISLVGFVIGQIISAPEVYDPGGFTLMVDDFCIADNMAWQTIGAVLLEKLHSIARECCCVQTVIVCGHHDDAKRRFLKSSNLQIASEWYVGPI